MGGFDLKTSSEQLTAEKSARPRYDIISPSRELTPTTFGGSELIYSFTVNSDEWIDLTKSFFRVDATLTDSTDIQLNYADGIGFAPSTVSCMLDSYRLNLNGTTIDKIDNNVAAIDMYSQRKQKGGAWLNGVGGVNNYEVSLKDRINKVVNDPHTNISQVQQYEAIYDNLNAIVLTGATTDRLGTTDGVKLWQNNNSSANSNFVVQNTPGASGFLCVADGTYKISVSCSIFCTAAPIGGSVNVVINGVAAVPSLKTFYNLGVNTSDNVCFIGNIACTAGQLVQVSISNTGGDANIDEVRMNIWDTEPNLVNPTVDEGVTKSSLIWKPPTSLYHTSVNETSSYLPTGKYELVLRVSSDYQKRMLQSTTNATDYKVSVSKADFYLHRLSGPRLTDVSYYIDGYSYTCQTRTAKTGTGMNDYQMTVPASTFELGLAVQSSQAGTTLQYPPSLFTTLNNVERQITQLYVNYANQTLPPQQETQGYVPGTKNLMQSHYVESYMLSNDEDESPLYYTSAGPESLSDYIVRGPFVSLPFKKDGTDRSTNATAFLSFDASPVNTNVLLFSKYRTSTLVQIKNGQVVSVSTDTS